MKIPRTFVLAIGLVPALAAAQAPIAQWPIDSGARVRVFSPAAGPKFVTGSLVTTTTDSVVIRPAKSAGSIAFGTPSIERFEVARGTHTRKTKGAFLGLVFGALAGAVTGAASYDASKCNEICIDSPGLDAALGGILLGSVGALIGAFVGSRPTDTWVPVAVPTGRY
jgi:hypothetical protein